jgi:peptidase E
MHSTLKPIYLFADSQLLFWQSDEGPFLLSVRKLVENDSAKAAYIGASNDDNPDYYGIFELAMESIGIEDCRAISSSLSKHEASFVEHADLILLAGGDVGKGWRAFERSGLKDLIIRRYSEGVLLIGVSAGATQLGMLGWPEADVRLENLFNTFGLVPFVISAHEEKSDWKMLKEVLQVSDLNVAGIGIPAGGGMIYHSDHSIEPVRYPLHEFSVEQGRIEHHLLSATT